MRRRRKSAPILISPATKYHRRLMRSARPPMWRRMRRYPVVVLFTLAFSALLYALVGPDPYAQETTPWDGNPANGTVEVSTSTLTLKPGETKTYRLRLTEQPVKMNRDGTYVDCDLNTPTIDICPDDGWWVRIRVDGSVRIAGEYEGFRWVPSVGWEFNQNNWDQWKYVSITFDKDATSSKSITVSHEVWANGTHCPVHGVGPVGVNGGNVSPPPPPPPPPLPPPPDITATETATGTETGTAAKTTTTGTETGTAAGTETGTGTATAATTERTGTTTAGTGMARGTATAVAETAVTTGTATAAETAVVETGTAMAAEPTATVAGRIPILTATAMAMPLDLPRPSP